MGIDIFSRADKKRVLGQLEPYGIEKLDYMLLQAGHRLRIFSGNIAKNDLITLLYAVRVDNLGLYFASLKDDGFRLSLDALHLFQDQLKGRILELNDDQARQWFMGESLSPDLPVEFHIGEFVILRHGGDFIGCGKFTGTKILNFLPKERLVR